ncbi:MAG: hypothetical protein KGJ32_12590, partial [Xanthomonadaceae bacterium]|nr:hypothetical protein [Xanthomonadaceae bacterium]
IPAKAGSSSQRKLARHPSESWLVIPAKAGSSSQRKLARHPSESWDPATSLFARRRLMHGAHELKTLDPSFRWDDEQKAVSRDDGRKRGNVAAIQM